MSLIQKNQQRWDNMHIIPSRVDGLANVAKRLVNPAAKAGSLCTLPWGKYPEKAAFFQLFARRAVKGLF